MSFGFDPEHYRDMKENKKLFDWMGYVADSNYGIPTQCPCGGRIVTEKCETDIAKSYFICKDYQDDGLHRKQMWYQGVEEELRMLRKEVDEQAETIRSMASHEFRLQELRNELNNKAEEIAKLKALVARVVGPIDF